MFEALLDSPSLEGWQQGKVRSLQTHFSKLPQLSSYAALQRLVRYMGYGDYLKEQHADTAKLDVLLALANQTPGVEEFLCRLRELREVVENQNPRPGCPFVLSTIHASKGLEYDRVIVVDVLDGLFPAVSEPWKENELSQEERNTLEEERRLFYVAVTRARYQLELLSYENKFGESSGTRSTFLSQLLGEEKKELPRAKKTVLPVRPTGPLTGQIAAWEKDYVPGTKIKHKAFGLGVLESRAGSIAVIDFGEKGIKKIDLPTCLRQGIIQLG